MLTKMKLGAAALATAVVAALIGSLVLGRTGASPREATAPGPAEAKVVAEPLAAHPSQALVQLVEAAGQGQAPPFLSGLSGRIPAGTAAVAQADQVDAGAEEGHAVPVTVWVDADDRVAGLQGTARFQSVPGGWKVAELQLEQLPLKVSTWADALAAARRMTAGAARDDAPFYGRFRFTDGARRVAVDAVTGQVEQE